MANTTHPQKFTIILLRLPDGSVVLQRRTQDAPYAPGLLGFFGGWVEDGETANECMIREIKEETSLDPDTLGITFVSDFAIPAGDDFNQDRHFYLYEGHLDNLNFEVYEGDGAEVYLLPKLKVRDDLTFSLKYALKQMVD